jgi:hypothetical protein
MPANTNRAIVSLAAAVIAALLTGGCSSQSSTPPAASSPSTNVPASATTAAATSTATGPMTGEELVWLEAITALHRKIDKVVTDAPSNLTSATLRSLADQLHGCTQELVRLGSPTTRLQPVNELATQGCAKYEQAAKCFATAASIGIPVAGTADERKFNESIDCGFAAPGEGSKLLAEAEVKGFEIKEAAAR